MSYKRETIFLNIKSTLQNIATGNGYENTITNISRKYRQWDQAGDYPALILLPGDCPMEHLATMEQFEATLAFFILAYVKSGEDVNKSGDIATLLESINGDVIKALYSDFRRGNSSFVDSTTVTSIEPYFDWENNIGISVINGEVLYKATFTDP